MGPGRSACRQNPQKSDSLSESFILLKVRHCPSRSKPVSPARGSAWCGRSPPLLPELPRQCRHPQPAPRALHQDGSSNAPALVVFGPECTVLEGPPAPSGVLSSTVAHTHSMLGHLRSCDSSRRPRQGQCPPEAQSPGASRGTRLVGNLLTLHPRLDSPPCRYQSFFSERIRFRG